MLPVHRVIGHKDWAKPVGRKQDPPHSKSWRQRRVAAFRPRTGASPAPPRPPEEDFMATMSETEKTKLLADVAAIRKATDWLDDDLINGNTPGQALRNVDNRTLEIRTLVQVLTAKVGEPVEATVELSDEDVAALAESLRAGLAPEVVRALGEKLVAA